MCEIGNRRGTGDTSRLRNCATERGQVYPITFGKFYCRCVRKLPSGATPTPPFGLSSLGKSDDCAMSRMVQAALGVTLHMPESTSALRSVHTRSLNYDITLPLPGTGFEFAVAWPASGWFLALCRGPVFNPARYPQYLNERESCICFWTSPNSCEKCFFVNKVLSWRRRLCIIFIIEKEVRTNNDYRSFDWLQWSQLHRVLHGLRPSRTAYSSSARSASSAAI